MPSYIPYIFYHSYTLHRLKSLAPLFIFLSLFSTASAFFPSHNNYMEESCPMNSEWHLSDFLTPYQFDRYFSQNSDVTSDTYVLPVHELPKEQGDPRGDVLKDLLRCYIDETNTVISSDRLHPKQPHSSYLRVLFDDQKNEFLNISNEHIQHALLHLATKCETRKMFLGFLFYAPQLAIDFGRRYRKKTESSAEDGDTNDTYSLGETEWTKHPSVRFFYTLCKVMYMDLNNSALYKTNSSLDARFHTLQREYDEVESGYMRLMPEYTAQANNACEEGEKDPMREDEQGYPKKIWMMIIAVGGTWTVTFLFTAYLIAWRISA